MKITMNDLMESNDIVKKSYEMSVEEFTEKYNKNYAELFDDGKINEKEYEEGKRFIKSVTKKSKYIIKDLDVTKGLRRKSQNKKLLFDLHYGEVMKAFKSNKKIPKNILDFYGIK